MAFCDDVNDILVNEAGRIGQMIPAKIIDQSPWIKLIRQVAFPEGIGYQISTLLYERTVIPAVNDSWTNMAPNTGTGNTCNLVPSELNFAQTLKQYNLQQRFIRTPALCVNDIRYAYQFREQLRQQYDIMEENTKWMWENRYRDEYLRVVGNKVIMTPGFPSDATSFPLVVPTARIDQGILDRYRLQMLRDGAGKDSYGMVDGTPQFVLILSPEASEYLKTQNSDTRQDLRFSTNPNVLLAPLGAEWSYRGFFHLIDFQAPRYNFTDGAYVRVPFYDDTPATYGEKAQVNPDYENAAYEVTFIFHPQVFNSRVPAPITSPGGNTRFDPVNYRGEFQWINYKSDCNPLGNTGYFLGVFANGTEVLRNEWGYAIMHLRCNPPTNFLACS